MSSKVIIGKEEWCRLPQLGLPFVKARIDSGAKTSSLHAFNIHLFEEDGKKYVDFDIHPIQRDRKLVRSCRGLVVDRREVKSSSGEKERRHVIKTPIMLGGETWDIEVTLTNRDSMGYRMLIGREAMKDRVLIDPDASFCLGNLSLIDVKKHYADHSLSKDMCNQKGSSVMTSDTTNVAPNIAAPDASSFDYHLPKEHPSLPSDKIGVLLVNLGTPDNTSWWGIRRYLKEFLSDPRVIEVPRWIWWAILNGIILTFRPRKTAKAYKKIWRKEENESPLRYFTRAQAALLQERINNQRKNGQHHDTNQASLSGETPPADALATRCDIVVEWAMRYGTPSIKSRMEKLAQQGCRRIAVIPLYPHYAAATTATVCDEVFRSLMRMRFMPTIRINEPYHDHPDYIKALASSVRRHIESLDQPPEIIVASYHGLPQSYFDKGDPYHCYCAKTTRLLREALGYDETQLIMTFQSRFGPKKWLQPYTDKTLIELAQRGIKHVAVITPAFASDCVETLEEIAIAAGESFYEHNGESLTLIPCLNDSEESIDVLESLTRKVVSGW